MENYLVTVRDALGELHNILCKDRGELSNLLNHLDDDKYNIIEVKVIDSVSSNIKTFCKQENLEIGG